MSNESGGTSIKKENVKRRRDATERAEERLVQNHPARQKKWAQGFLRQKRRAAGKKKNQQNYFFWAPLPQSPEEPFQRRSNGKKKKNQDQRPCARNQAAS